MNLGRSSIIVFISKIVSQVIGFIGMAYYSRELGSTILGTFFLLQSLVGVLGVPGDLGVQGALEKRVSEGREKNELISASIIFLTSSFAIIGLITFLFRQNINSYLEAPLFWELLSILAISIIGSLFLSFLRGELKIEYSAVLDGVRTLATLVVSVGLVVYGLRIYALIYGLIFGKLLVLILSVWIAEFELTIPQRSHLESILSFSKYNMILRTSHLIYSWTDTLIIGFFLSNSFVGIYEIAWKVSTISVLASNSIGQVIFPHFSNLHADEKFQEISESIPSAITYSLIIPVGMFFGALVLSQEVLSTIFGPGFGAGGMVLILLLGQRILHALYKTFYEVTMAFDNPDIAFRISSVSILLNIGLNLILVPMFGIEGAAIAMLLAYVINLILYYRHVDRIIELQVPVRDIAHMIASGGVMALTIGVVNIFVDGSTLIGLIAIINIGVIIYFSLIYIWNEALRIKSRQIISYY